MPEIRNPGTAAVLSAIIPGLGQFYNGDFIRGIFWLSLSSTQGPTRAIPFIQNRN